MANTDPIDTHGHTVADVQARYPNDMALSGTNLTGTVEADDDKFAITAHGLGVGDKIKLISKTGGTGLTVGDDYFVKAVADADHFTVSATDGGAVVDVTVDASAVAVAQYGVAGSAEFADGDIDAASGDIYLAQSAAEVLAQIG